MEINRPFLGYALNAVDAKGRVSVPSAFRDLITARCRDFGAGNDPANDKQINVVLHAQCDRLVAYDAIGIRKLSSDLAASVAELPAAEQRQALADLASDELGNILTLSFDGAGRLVLPDTLRGMVGITDQALFWGGLDSFEIWDPRKAREAFAGNPRKRATLEGLFAAKERG